MADLRRKTPAFVYGDYKDVDPNNAKVYAYTRTLGKEKYLVVLNFSESAVAYNLPIGLNAGQLAISNLGKPDDRGEALHLKAWEARVYKQ
jgi:oligo-1,6-glucosidase